MRVFGTYLIVSRVEDRSYPWVITDEFGNEIMWNIPTWFHAQYHRLHIGISYALERAKD